MSEATDKNKAQMRRVYDEMWNQGKPTLAAELFEHPAGVESFVGQFLTSFPDLHHTVEQMIAENDQITVKFSAHGTHTGIWQGFAPSGRSIQYTGITWAHIVTGKIREHHTEWDKAGLLEQLGG